MRTSGGAPVRTPRAFWMILSCVLALLGATLTIAAQNTPRPAASAPTGPSLLVIVDVKPEMWDDYVALQKAEAIPALRKAGIDRRSAWRTAMFGRSYEVAYLYQLTSFSILDGESPMRRALGEAGERAYNAKVRRMVQGSRSLAMRVRPELGFASADGRATPMMGVLAHVFTTAGKQTDFEALVKSDWAPGLRKAAVPLYSVYEVVMGGEVGEFYTFTPIDNLASLDDGHPITRALGGAGYESMMMKLAPLIRHAERTVIRRDAELSFTTASTSSQ